MSATFWENIIIKDRSYKRRIHNRNHKKLTKMVSFLFSDHTQRKHFRFLSIHIITRKLGASSMRSESFHYVRSIMDIEQYFLYNLQQIIQKKGSLVRIFKKGIGILPVILQTFERYIYYNIVIFFISEICITYIINM